MSEQFATVGTGVTLCYETFGPEDGPPLLLVMGLGTQMIMWEDGFIAELVARGARVIRYDNRDCGRSTIFDEHRPPGIRQLLFRDRRAAAYPLTALADDAIGLLDHLGIERADIAGMSMGGMIVQLLAINHPDRVRSVTSIMSSTGDWKVGWPRPDMALRLVRPRPKGREAYIADYVENYTAIASRTNPPDPEVLREIGSRSWDRGTHPAGTARQLIAIQTTPDRTRALGGVRMPASVIHGREDRLINRSGGRATAKAIPGAHYLELDGMGHDLPRSLWPTITGAITETAARAATASPAHRPG